MPVCVGERRRKRFFNYSNNINFYNFLNVNCKRLVKGIKLNLFFHLTSLKYVNYTRIEHKCGFETFLILKNEKKACEGRTGRMWNDTTDLVFGRKSLEFLRQLSEPMNQPHGSVAFNDA